NGEVSRGKFVRLLVDMQGGKLSHRGNLLAMAVNGVASDGLRQALSRGSFECFRPLSVTARRSCSTLSPPTQV
ncbi:MAG: hypothetical protein VW317_09925, partial [Halieaceae bacterium]